MRPDTHNNPRKKLSKKQLLLKKLNAATNVEEIKSIVAAIIGLRSKKKKQAKKSKPRWR